MSFLSRSLAFGLFFFNGALGASIPRNGDLAPRTAIAVKLSPATLKTRDARSGAQIVESLVRGAQNVSHSKRDTEFNVSPLITSLTPEQLAELVDRAVKTTPSYVPADFGAWYQVQFKTEAPSEGYDPEILDLLRTLGSQDEVASCQPLVGSKSPVVSPLNDPQFANQDYLKAAPGGIEAQYAWGFTGGDGANTRVIDIERGWKLDHEDLVGHILSSSLDDNADNMMQVTQNITLLAGMNVLDRYGGNYPHGTAVLGEMLMADNTIGGVGIVPNAKGDVVGIQRTVGGAPVENQAEAIIDAASFLGYGGMLTIPRPRIGPH